MDADSSDLAAEMEPNLSACCDELKMTGGSESESTKCVTA
jgi:hypothetical protein